jgi:hypothetical protein
MSNRALVDNLNSSTANLDADVEFLPRRAAGAWLQKNFGFGSEKTLAKQSWNGTGPVSYRSGAKVLYRIEDLREWARNQVSGPVTSAADNKQRKQAAKGETAQA